MYKQVWHSLVGFKLTTTMARDWCSTSWAITTTPTLIQIHFLPQLEMEDPLEDLTRVLQPEGSKHLNYAEVQSPASGNHKLFGHEVLRIECLWALPRIKPGFEPESSGFILKLTANKVFDTERIWWLMSRATKPIINSIAGDIQVHFILESDYSAQKALMQLLRSASLLNLQQRKTLLKLQSSNFHN